MKLKVLDQVHVSSVSSDTLAPGAEIEVSDALGAELLAKHPEKFDQLDEPKAKKAPAPKNKKAAAPRNKAAAKPAAAPAPAPAPAPEGDLLSATSATTQG